MKGVSQAVDLLEDALRKQRRLLILGDYDADGATSCALAMRSLRSFGFRNVDFLVPDRIKQGYGLSVSLAEQASQLGAEILLTVDNGIASIEGVERANQLAMPVIVTDHHLPASRLPNAAAIVNPNQPGCEFPEKSLAGVGVLLYLLLALRAQLREVGWFKQNNLSDPDLSIWLDVVALGTVADLVPLGRLNRLLVAYGVRRVRSGQGVPGIRCLMQVAGRDWRRTLSSDFGFAVGPRINAAGRLEDISLGIRCLLEDDEGRAMDLARQLDQINRERRARQDLMQQQAEQLLEQLHELETDLPHAVCIYRADWHEGVIGLLASRIREKTHRPTLVLAQAGNGLVKGSGRSIAGFHLRDALELVHSRNPGLIKQFGGHAMAAGLTLEESGLDQLKQAFVQVAREQLHSDQLKALVLTDGTLPADEHNLETASMLQSIVPWGQACPEPVFEAKARVEAVRWLKDLHLKIALRLEDQIETLDAIWFFAPDESRPLKTGQRVHLAYRLSVNQFQGNESVQLVVEALAPLE